MILTDSTSPIVEKNSLSVSGTGNKKRAVPFGTALLKCLQRNFI
jgi:site-specific recombinase XerD